MPAQHATMASMMVEAQGRGAAPLHCAGLPHAPCACSSHASRPCATCTACTALQVQQMYEQALTEDPTIFDYDGVYDSMQAGAACRQAQHHAEHAGRQAGRWRIGSHTPCAH